VRLPQNLMQIWLALALIKFSKHYAKEKLGQQLPAA